MRENFSLFMLHSSLVLVLLLACSPAQSPTASPRLAPSSPASLFPTPEPALALPSPLGEPETTSLVVSHGRSLAFAPILVALRKGFFAAEGLRVRSADLGEVDATRAVLLRSGQVQFVAAPGGFEALAAQDGAQPLNVYNYLDRSLQSVAIRAEIAERLGLHADTPLTQRFRALDGLVVGVSSLQGPGGWQAGYVAAQAGLRSGADVPIVEAGSGLTLISNLEVGLVDAIVDAAPVAEHAVARGQAVMLVDNPRGQDPGLVPYHMASVYTRADFAEGNPRATARFVRAVDRAVQWIAASRPDQVGSVLAQDFQDDDFAVLVAGVSSVQHAIDESGVLVPQAAANLLKVHRGLSLSAEQITAAYTDQYLRLARQQP